MRLDRMLQLPAGCARHIIRLDVCEEGSTMLQHAVVPETGLTRRLDRLRTHTLVRKVVLLLISGANHQNMGRARQCVSAFDSCSMRFAVDKAEVHRVLAGIWRSNALAWRAPAILDQAFTALDPCLASHMSSSSRTVSSTTISAVPGAKAEPTPYDWRNSMSGMWYLRKNDQPSLG